MRILKVGVKIAVVVFLLVFGAWKLLHYIADDRDTDFTRELDIITLMKNSRAEKAQEVKAVLLEAVPVGTKISEVVVFFKENGAECYNPDEILEVTLKQHGRVYVCQIYRLHPEFKSSLFNVQYFLFDVQWIFKLSLSEDEQNFTGIAFANIFMEGL